jgi:3'-phosphoadenosine 5'-phosphosulfate sulfotransferase (PAPS reductase)/FAD synthetase
MILRDENGIAHVVGLSGGKDSTALALALAEFEPRPYTYLYTPTGDELPEMVGHLHNLEKILGQKIIKISNGTLASQTEEREFLPNVFARWCTAALKLVPATKFYADNAPVICYVGLRADEDDREGLRGSGSLQKFPFKEWGWDEDLVWEYLSIKGVSIPKRTDCARCPYQKLGEWYNLFVEHPEIYADAVADEEKYGHTYRSPGRDTWPASLKELAEEFKSGRIPERSLRMMEKRRGMCRACSL